VDASNGLKDNDGGNEDVFVEVYNVYDVNFDDTRDGV